MITKKNYNDEEDYLALKFHGVNQIIPKMKRYELILQFCQTNCRF